MGEAVKLLRSQFLKTPSLTEIHVIGKDDGYSVSQGLGCPWFQESLPPSPRRPVGGNVFQLLVLEHAPAASVGSLNPVYTTTNDPFTKRVSSNTIAYEIICLILESLTETSSM